MNQKSFTPSILISVHLGLNVTLNTTSLNTYKMSHPILKYTDGVSNNKFWSALILERTEYLTIIQYKPRFVDTCIQKIAFMSN